MEPITDLDAGTLRRIDWRELFPATLLLRALTVAMRLMPILGGTLFVLAVLLILELSCAVSPNDFYGFRWGVCLSELGRWLVPTSQSAALRTPSGCPTFFGAGFLSLPHWPAATVIVLAELFFALMISRSAAVRIASTEHSGIGASFAFACQRFLAMLLAFALPLIFTACCLLPVWAIEQAGVSVRFALMPIELFCVFLATLLLLGLALGLPLAVAAAATDRCDGFDAFSRAFSYLFQRPFHFLFYLTIIALFGALGFVIVDFLVRIVLSVVSVPAGASTCGCSFLVRWGTFWLVFVRFAPFGFLFVYKYTAFTALYIILRRSVDGIPMDRFAPSNAEEPHRLPPILADAEGAPIFETKTETIHRDENSETD